MFPLKPAVVFLAKLVGIYVLLMIPWPGWPETYALLFRGAGQWAFGSIGEGGHAEFRPLVDSEDDSDTSIILTHDGVPGSGRKIEDGSRRSGYIPTAAVAALILATPIRWPRKGWALLWGLLLAQVFVALRLGLPIYRAFCMDDEFREFALSPLWQKALYQFIAAVRLAPASMYIVPVFIWIAVSFRREDLVRLRGLIPMAADEDAAEHGKPASRGK